MNKERLFSLQRMKEVLIANDPFLSTKLDLQLPFLLNHDAYKAFIDREESIEVSEFTVLLSNMEAAMLNDDPRVHPDVRSIIAIDYLIMGEKMYGRYVNPGAIKSASNIYIAHMTKRKIF